MKVPDFFKSTQAMLLQAFPDGIDEESYWVLLYLLYDYMADENLALVMSSFVKKTLGMIENDIYKACDLKFDENVIQQVKCRLNTYGFEEWKNEE